MRYLTDLAGINHLLQIVQHIAAVMAIQFVLHDAIDMCTQIESTQSQEKNPMIERDRNVDERMITKIFLDDTLSLLKIFIFLFLSFYQESSIESICYFTRKRHSME